MENIKLLFGGDFVITDKFNPEKLLTSEVKKLFNESDFNILNLEAPVTKSNSKILKTGPHLMSEYESTLSLLKALNIGIVTLANNHILDYGEIGVSDTIQFCKVNNIIPIGAGMKLNEASQTLLLDTKIGKIAIINFAENEWASATEESAGANPMNTIDNANQIKEAKECSDFVFVIVHGGHEYYSLPSPRMQKQYRFYADQGADIVIGHHTHCISGNEIYNDVPIFYSLGNFIFTKHNANNNWYIGNVLEVTIKNGNLFTKIHPIKQDEKTFRLKLLENNEKQDVLNKIFSYNEIIIDDSKLNYEWRCFINKKYKTYINLLSPFSYITNRYIKGLIFKLRIKGLTKKGMRLKLNLIRCESHYDLTKEVIKRYLSR